MITQFQTLRVTKYLLTVLCLIGGCACSQPAGVTPEEQALSRRPDEAARPATAKAAGDESNLKRLEALWRTRTQSGASDYPIGAGDVLEVSVPAIPELGQRAARVSGDGTISLPMIGTVEAHGLTEEKLREEIAGRLEKYMYRPQVDVFVKEYYSRQVAVVGAVRTPGLVTLASPSETILGVITRAGGMTEDAADQIVFIPAEQGGKAAAERISSIAFSGAEPDGTARKSAASKDGEAIEKQAMSLIPPTAQPIAIGVHSTSLGGAAQYLGLPVRPGDVIVVPGGGDVMVVGWVQYPGHFKVGSGLTVLGAIGAAGGPMFAANRRHISLIRTDKDGAKRVLPVDLQEIEGGDQPDLAVQGNDVVEVPYSSLKIAPYIFYNLVTRVGYGFGIPVP